MYVSDTNKANIQQRREWMAQLPSIISTLGVLGTFIGITKGLIAFDTQNLNFSIPDLLSGLKTAFFTSLLGMIGGMLMNRMVSRKLDVVGEQSEISLAVKELKSALLQNRLDLNNNIRQASQNITNAIDNMANTISNISIASQTNNNTQSNNIISAIEQIKDDVEEVKAGINQSLEIAQTEISQTNNNLNYLKSIDLTAKLISGSALATENNLTEFLNNED